MTCDDRWVEPRDRLSSLSYLEPIQGLLIVQVLCTVCGDDCSSSYDSVDCLNGNGYDGETREEEKSLRDSSSQPFFSFSSLSRARVVCWLVCYQEEGGTVDVSYGDAGDGDDDGFFVSCFRRDSCSWLLLSSLLLRLMTCVCLCCCSSFSSRWERWAGVAVGVWISPTVPVTNKTREPVHSIPTE